MVTNAAVRRRSLLPSLRRNPLTDIVPASFLVRWRRLTFVLLRVRFVFRGIENATELPYTVRPLGNRKRTTYEKRRRAAGAGTVGGCVQANTICKGQEVGKLVGKLVRE